MISIQISSILAAWPSTYNVVFDDIEFRLNTFNSWVELNGTLSLSQSSDQTLMVITPDVGVVTPIGISWRAYSPGNKTIQSIAASTSHLDGFPVSPYLEVAGVPLHPAGSGYVDVLYIDENGDFDAVVTQITFTINTLLAAPCPSQPSYPAAGQRLPWGNGPRNDVVVQPGCPPVPSYGPGGQRWPYGFTQ